MAARKTPSRGGKPDKLMRTALALELHRDVDGTAFGFVGKVKRLRLVAHALVEKAIAGDTAAIKEIHERMDGKVPQALEHGGEGGGPLTVEIVQFSHAKDKASS